MKSRMKMNLKALDHEEVDDLFANAEKLLDDQTDDSEVPRTHAKAEAHANPSPSSNNSTDQMIDRKLHIEKRAAVEQAKVDVQYSKLQDVKRLKERLENSSLENLKKQQQDPTYRALVRKQIQESQTNRNSGCKFISPELEEIAPLIPGQITVICATSGSGKSTLTGAIASQNVQAGKRVLIISNEAPANEVRIRVSCAALGLSANDHANGKMNQTDKETMLDKIDDQFDLLTVQTDPGVTTTIEGVMRALRAAADDGFDLVLLDYFQLVTNSTEAPGLEAPSALWKFKNQLQSYTSEGNKTPVIVFAQVNPTQSSDMLERDLEQRVKWCKGLKEAANVFMEVVRVTDTYISVFCIDKSRFGEQKSFHHHIFSKGIYKAATKIEVKEELSAAKARKVARKADEIED